MTAVLTIGVRALCAFAARRGDLDRRFHLSPTALEGQAGHRSTVARRSPGYLSEVRLEGQVAGLLLRGRADGFDPTASRLEEIKTFRGRFDDIKANQRALHQAQLHVYGYLMCKTQALDTITLALCYVDIVTAQEIVESAEHYFVDLETEVERLCARFQSWRAMELEHRAERHDALRSLTFPFTAFRSGQRDLAEAVYRAGFQNRTLLLEASTGLGKTVATFFPILKAWPEKEFDKVFFLSARNTGLTPALSALKTLFPARPVLRVLELVAKDRACVHPDKECHGDSCPLAAQFYDRLPAARQQVIDQAGWDSADITQIAAEHLVCPYYLRTELVGSADVVVGDYNYYFDRGALLFDMTVENEWNVTLLVDEAHNLLARGRDMYSAALDSVAMRLVRRALPRGPGKHLSAFLSAWRGYAEEDAYQALAEAPARLLATLSKFINGLSDWQIERNAPLPDEVRQIYFAAIRFHELASKPGTHCFVEMRTELHGPRFRSRLALQNVYPAPYFAARFARASSTILFSATLQPFEFQRNILGLPQRTLELVVASPFSTRQLAIRVAAISMRFHERSKNLLLVAHLIKQQVSDRPGNYMVFASSYDYLGQLDTALRQIAPHLDLHCQRARMSALERAQFLSRFSSQSHTVGLAVMGGVFSEGIDLPGDYLIGAFVCTLGLASIDATGQEMQRRMDVAFHDGFAYQFLFPAMQRVIQAAGRVIRSPEDRGTLFLIDERFIQARIRRLLPAWWDLDGISQQQRPPVQRQLVAADTREEGIGAA